MTEDRYVSVCDGCGAVKSLYDHGENDDAWEYCERCRDEAGRTAESSLPEPETVPAPTGFIGRLRRALGPPDGPAPLGPILCTLCADRLADCNYWDVARVDGVSQPVCSGCLETLTERTR